MNISSISDQLNGQYRQFPGCCLALSTPLLNALINLLPEQPNFTLSIGSGTGLLESLITYRDGKTLVEGVEIGSTVNRYITEESMHVVTGGWGLCPRARDAAAWMFVYPRDPGLISKYIDQYPESVEIIIWLGPKNDWADYEPVFSRSLFSELQVLEAGLAPYETAVVARKA